jgi:hypothetical protein
MLQMKAYASLWSKVKIQQTKTAQRLSLAAGGGVTVLNEYR